jgi:hypothetical protein
VHQRTQPMRHARARRVAAGLAGGALFALTSLVWSAPGAGAASGQSPTLAQARKDLLTLSDMPSGWTSTKNPNTANNTAGSAQLAHCLSVSKSLIVENPPSVYSKQFQDPQGVLNVSDNVAVFPSAKNATAEYALAGDAKFPRCMTSLASGPLKEKLFGKPPKGTTMGTPLVSAVAATAFGPDIDGYSLSVPITTQGQTLNVTVTELIVVKGRLGHQVTFTSAGAPFSLALEQQIMKVAAERL